VGEIRGACLGFLMLKKLGEERARGRPGLDRVSLRAKKKGGKVRFVGPIEGKNPMNTMLPEKTTPETRWGWGGEVQCPKNRMTQ